MERLMNYESATEELRDFLGRDDFRVVWNPQIGKYEIQQYMLGGLDEIRLILDGKPTVILYPCHFWSTVKFSRKWDAEVMKDIKLGLVRTAKDILENIEQCEEKRQKANERYIEDGSYEIAKGMVQATDHRKIYSTPA